MPRKRIADARGAFTLIEILTVIAILMILIGILLPSIERVIWSARRSACANNLHHLGIEMNHYALKYDHWYPPHNSGNPTQVSAEWKDFFEKESTSSEILFCPAAHPDDLADFARTAWADATPTTDYEIPAGDTALSSLPKGPWTQVELMPNDEMMAGDLMGKESDWVGNHRTPGTGTQGPVIGRNVLFGDGRVMWIDKSDSDSRSYATDGSRTYYLPDKP
ncbi:MAG: hypothetical protein BIFFINMI_03928 [Phycisphaerae bacterium]|nr:hypothetical protein [Phycisphaerae bacterium]